MTGSRRVRCADHPVLRFAPERPAEQALPNLKAPVAGASGQPAQNAADKLCFPLLCYAPIVALAVSLHGPVSPQVLSQRTM